MIIELMSCTGCQRIIDQYNFPPRCPRCGSKYHKSIGPSYLVMLRWFLASPRHVCRLLIKDWKERHEA